MKKIILMGALLFASSFMFAYNPPLGGENIFKLTNPTLLGGGASATGGPFNEVIPESICFNPALTGWEQRNTVNAAASILIDSDDTDGCSETGWGIQLGWIFPNKWCVVSIAAEGIFCNNIGLDIGKEAVLHLGLAKDINENISIGLNGYFGYFFEDGADYIVGADLGFIYKFERLGFLKNPRVGISLLNMGKPLSGDYNVVGIDGTKDGTSYPGIFTPRLSFSADLFSVGSFEHRLTGAFNVDASFPTFQNAVFEMAFGLSYNNMVNLTVGWEANVREIAASKKVSWPSVGLGLHFVISSGDSKDTWEQNELLPAVAWQNLYNGIQDISIGATMYIGMTDNEAPEIYLWGEKLEADDSEE